MWLSDVSLVLRDRVIPCGALRIENGLIAEIVETAGTATHTVYPGFVDMHGDMIKHELEPRPGVDFPMHVAVTHLDARLAAAGVTTAYAGVSFSRTAKDGDRRSYQHTTEIIQALKSQQAGLRVDHRVHARFDITFTAAIEALESLLASGSVDLVSVMDHTPGQGQYRNLEKLIAYRVRDGKVSEEEARAQIQARIDGAVSPEEIYANLQTVSRLCKSYGVAVASHDDDTEEKANIMADIGAVISEFPVTMEAAEVAVARGMMTAMGAPNAMRGQSYSGNLSARDAHAASLLHILAADYHPAAILPAIHALVKTDPKGLPGAVCLAASNPAEALGLNDRGEIAVGKRADLALVDPHLRVVKTLCAGNVVFSNGSVTTAPNNAIAAA
ncbi:alpha-D-ribose 1-methylphosphonate 5-triphosphate diphosphatase [Shimia isoporae]|uniref:Alpha-D-ribose 1-methylphosphonate 5-triphosphate diphosphatase n=1 Tax=Shimia isoporae TaxID=647720 RepID=A0A4R1NSP1_9RHOB|nr:alpha-D-ribose 1-methylphosphonate 5-triphosphate diphosphatase [Shimia isoporae]TCL08278.1 alpha-D-ribose 1-methylphosphonate 5-triphosphate diphosphatase [Shimia isoporae]